MGYLGQNRRSLLTRTPQCMNKDILCIYIKTSAYVCKHTYVCIQTSSVQSPRFWFRERTSTWWTQPLKSFPFSRVLQCVAVCCSVLQCVAVCCSVLLMWAFHSAEIAGIVCLTAWHCNTLQCTTTNFNTLQRTATNFNTLQQTATHCNTQGFYV